MIYIQTATLSYIQMWLPSPFSVRVDCSYFSKCVLCHVSRPKWNIKSEALHYFSIVLKAWINPLLCDDYWFLKPLKNQAGISTENANVSVYILKRFDFKVANTEYIGIFSQMFDRIVVFRTGDIHLWNIPCICHQIIGKCACVNGIYVRSFIWVAIHLWRAHIKGSIIRNRWKVCNVTNNKIIFGTNFECNFLIISFLFVSIKHVRFMKQCKCGNGAAQEKR